MLKKQTWQQFAEEAKTGEIHPTTIRSYLNICENYLIEPASDVVASEYVLTNDATKFDIECHDQTIGMLESQLTVVGSSMCFLCSATFVCSSEHVISANPFTRAQYMTMCKNCVKKLEQ